ncbi:hypothetical protein MIND_00720900 [Mycena indigotica]|uniref:EH domain-containing protein n=1 Tax=Mycena indigotica TaxID=2126181 RepID=A0A8H6W6X7_9AGAR|nr:uncharacterized protein MIND_00720900 [Mycena indigotica]KAF7301554.1 hypothetical protein MIND_00720900 [Mycena indigotica]
MASSFVPTANERAIVDKIFSQKELHDLGILPGDIALELFNKTNLPLETLSDIWNVVDTDRHGWLTPQQTGAAVRLIGLAQSGAKPINSELLAQPGPPAHIPDISDVASTIPALTPEDKAKYRSLFRRTQLDGLVGSEKARNMFAKFTASEEIVSRIWKLADTQQREALDITDFAIAMHLIQWITKDGPSVVLPTTLPKGLYEQAASGPSSPLIVPKPLSPSSSPPRLSLSPGSNSSGFDRRISRSVLASPSSPMLSPNSAAGPSRRASYSPLPSPRNDEKSASVDWKIPDDLRARANREFDALDPLKSGSIPDNVSLPFLMESKLSTEDLAHLWTLADLNDDGNLTREGFAIALYLVDERLRGRILPPTLPPSLKPEVERIKPPLVPPKSPKAPGTIRRPAPLPPKSAPPPPPPAKPHTLSSRSFERPAQPRLSIPSFDDNFTPADTFRRRATSVVYPTLPAHANHVRFSSVWSPDNKMLAPLTESSPRQSTTNPDPQDVIIHQLEHRIGDMQTKYNQLRLSNTEQAVSLANITQENVSLRVVIEELQCQLASHDLASARAVNQVLAAENEGLRKALELSVTEVKQLQTSHTDAELHRIEVDDLRRENERLRSQVDEMRASTTQLPWSGGDSELQTLINEDLARENARLRLESRESQDKLTQATSGQADQQRANEELTQTNERLQTEAQTIRTRFETQRREFRQLAREVERLKNQLRGSNNANGAASGSYDAEIQPPAYNEVPTAILD